MRSPHSSIFSVERLVAFTFVAVFLAGCASAPRVRSEFGDIPVPRGLIYQPDKSTVIESPTVKAARLVYRGRLEPKSLVVALRSMLEANGWAHVSTTAGPSGTIQAYEKGEALLQVRIWEGWWFTFLELTGSRVLQASR
jgi:hypothetical protein